MVAATSHRAVSALLRDRRFGREVPPDRQPAVPAHLAPFYAVERHSMLELEPPRHTRLRGLVLRAFTSRRIAALAGRDRGAVPRPDRPLSRTARSTCCPPSHARLPVIVICRLLGVPEAMADDLLAWSNAMVAMYQARRARAMEDAAAAAAAGLLRPSSASMSRPAAAAPRTTS